jgi:hypothetical protein
MISIDEAGVILLQNSTHLFICFLKTIQLLYKRFCVICKRKTGGGLIKSIAGISWS